MYLSNLTGLCITGPLDLVWTPPSEPNAEQPKSEVIRSFHIYMSFNQRLPFPYQRSQLVSCKIHSLNIIGTNKKCTTLVKKPYKNIL